MVFGEAEWRSHFQKEGGGRPHEDHLCPRGPKSRFPRASARGLHFLLPPDWLRAATTNGAGRRLAGLPPEGRKRTRRARALRRQLCTNGRTEEERNGFCRQEPPIGAGATMLLLHALLQNSGNSVLLHATRMRKLLRCMVIFKGARDTYE